MPAVTHTLARRQYYVSVIRQTLLCSESSRGTPVNSPASDFITPLREPTSSGTKDQQNSRNEEPVRARLHPSYNHYCRSSAIQNNLADHAFVLCLTMYFGASASVISLNSLAPRPHTRSCLHTLKLMAFSTLVLW
jgi:hypothetical protein